jgi:hypothetical protein
MKKMLLEFDGSADRYFDFWGVKVVEPEFVKLVKYVPKMPPPIVNSNGRRNLCVEQ